MSVAALLTLHACLTDWSNHLRFCHGRIESDQVPVRFHIILQIYFLVQICKNNDNLLPFISSSKRFILINFSSNCPPIWQPNK
jgi:hypothetical protein